MTDAASIDAPARPQADGRAPWFEVRVDDGAVLTAGSPDVLLGHSIPRDDGPDDGSWVRWEWDGQRLLVTNDRFRTYPCYFAATDDSFRISPSIDRLLALGTPRDIDLDALSAFLAVGFHIGEDTSFRAIRALPPAARLEWRSGAWGMDSDPPVFTTVETTRQQAQEGTVELFRQAMGRRPPGDEPFRMAVSGGRDSRHILLELHRRGTPPELAVTAAHNPYDWGDDIPAAAALCERLGVDHRALVPTAPLPAEARKNRMTSYASAMHAWFIPVVDALTGRTDVTYEGTPGYTATGTNHIPGRLLAHTRAGRWDEAARDMGKKDHGSPRYLSLLAQPVRQLLTADRAVARIRGGLDDHLHASDPYLSFRMMNRTGRELTLTANALLAGVRTVHTPYYDADLLPFSMGIPRELIDDDFHSDSIAAEYPMVADVPYSQHRRPHVSRAYMRALDRELLRFLLRHARGTLVDRPGLILRAATGAVTGDGWFAWGRRYSLTVMLVQLEQVLEGHVRLE